MSDYGDDGYCNECDGRGFHYSGCSYEGMGSGHYGSGGGDGLLTGIAVALLILGILIIFM